MKHLRKLWIGLAVLAGLYFVVIVFPLMLVLSIPADGFDDNLSQVTDAKQKTLAHWSPLTGIWGIERWREEK